MNNKLVSIKQAVNQGIDRLRLPNWALPEDHIKIDIIKKGINGPWIHH